MKVLFAGTPVFAREALERILDEGFRVPLVLTQPDRPAGRGMKLQPSAVKQLAEQHGVAVAQPRGLRLDGRFSEDALQARTMIEAAKADVMVVAAYGLILPQWVLDAPRLGCINIHASLLPRWRGAAPIHRAIEAGDTKTGITIMQMDAGLDTGDTLAVHALDIGDNETTPLLHDRLASLGAQMVVNVLQRLSHAPLPRTPQPQEGVTYAQKISKTESPIDWRLSAEMIARRVRALSPTPGATALMRGENIKVIDCEVDSEVLSMNRPLGQILSISSVGIGVACGDGVLRLKKVQRAGGKPLAAADFARGFAVREGMAFEVQATSVAPGVSC